MMSEQRFTTNESPHIVVTSCRGKVVVRSWRETAVSAQSESVTAVPQAPNAIHLAADGDLYLAVPKQASLTLGAIGGSLTIKHVSGGITVDDVAGAVTLRNVDAVTITHAAQGVQADNVNGLLALAEVGGTANLRSVSAVQITRALADVVVQFANGHVNLEQVDGRLEIRTVNGDVTVSQAQGEVVLANLGGQVRLSAAQTVWLVGGLASGAHQLATADNIYIYWPLDAPLNLTAHAPVIVHDLPLTAVNEATDNNQTTLTGRIEEGQVDLFVQAGRRAALKLLTAEPQFSPADFVFAPPPAAASEPAALAAAVRAVMAELAAELPPETLAQLAAIGLEERLVTAVTAPTPAAAPSPTDDERHILQLLKDDQISVAQAQILLAALKNTAGSA